MKNKKIESEMSQIKMSSIVTMITVIMIVMMKG